MRESRTYGSGRGACHEMHVPTATTARVHHAARRCGSVAGCGKGAAGRSHLSPRYLAQSGAAGAAAPPFYDELRRLGFAEGQNLIVDSRGYAARTEQFPAVAAELVKSQVDAILAGGAAALWVAQAATRTIPIFTLTDDMVGQGLAASLARPGGNITGISILATELDGKRQEILMDLVNLLPPHSHARRR